MNEGRISKGKVLFLMDPNLGHVTISIRGLVFRELLIKCGWDVEFINIHDYTHDGIVSKAQEFDIVYLLKVASLSLINKIKNSTGVKIIFDLTDALWKPFHRRVGWGDLEEILQTVDVIVSENDYICEFGYQYNQTVFSIPVYLPLDKFEAAKQERENNRKDKIRIGWVGSNGTVSALEKIQKPLNNLLRRYPQLELRILGCNNTAVLSNLPLDRISIVEKYDEDRMIQEIVEMDIGVFPPPLDIEDYCVRGALKGMLYMAAGIPAIFQNDGDCLNFVEDGVNAMLASDECEWEQKMERLISSQEFRHKMGACGLETISKGHSIEYVNDILDRVLTSVLHMYKPISKK